MTLWQTCRHHHIQLDASSVVTGNTDLVESVTTDDGCSSNGPTLKFTGAPQGQVHPSLREIRNGNHKNRHVHSVRCNALFARKRMNTIRVTLLLTDGASGDWSSML